MRRMVVIWVGTGAVIIGIFLCQRSPRHEIKPTPLPSESLIDSSAKTPRIAAVARPVEVPVTETNTPTNSILRYIHGEEMPKLTVAQVEPFLAVNRRSAGSLLAAFRTTGESNYLRDAMAQYPKDPRVNYAAACSANLTPDERRQAMEALKQSDPNNALGSYLSAADYFKSGQQQLALQEMNSASTKPGWQDYTADFIQNAQEAYRAAGYPEVEAKYIAAANALLPDLAQIKSVGVNLTDLAKTYQQDGDALSAQAMFQSALNLGQQISSSQEQPLITTLVGMAIQRMALAGMDPNAPYGDSGQTVQDQLNAIAQQRAMIKDLVAKSEPLVNVMNDQDIIMYQDRQRLFGPLSTYQWVLQKYGAQ